MTENKGSLLSKTAEASSIVKLPLLAKFGIIFPVFALLI